MLRSGPHKPTRTVGCRRGRPFLVRAHNGRTLGYAPIAIALEANRKCIDAVPIDVRFSATDPMNQMEHGRSIICDDFHLSALGVYGFDSKSAHSTAPSISGSTMSSSLRRQHAVKVWR